MDKLEVWGYVDNVEMKLTLELQPGEAANPEFMAGLLGNLNQSNWQPRASSQLAAAAAAVPGAVQVAGPAVPAAPVNTGHPAQQAAPAANGAGCPIHGLTNVKRGFRGVGNECGVYDAQPQPWTQDKPWQSKTTGEIRYYCSSRW